MVGWPDGRMTGWLDDRMVGWPDDQMAKSLDDPDNQMVGWPDGQMTWWSDGQKSGWPDGQMAGWSDGRMARSPDDQMARRPYGQKSRWHIKQILKKWCSQCYTGYTPNVLPDSVPWFTSAIKKGNNFATPLIGIVTLSKRHIRSRTKDTPRSQSLASDSYVW